MIPKGLLVAIIVGVSASLALGLYFEKTYNKQGLEFTDGSAISILTDKYDYDLNEKIIVQIINSGTSEVSFQNDLASFRVRALDGTEFFSTSFDGTKLAPKEKYTFEWNQQKNDNSHILEGRYVLESFAYDGGKHKIHDSTTINIFK